MRLRHGVAINLAFITCLSAFMLGLGQSDAALPLLMLFTALVSLYLTDFRRWIRLGDWTVNAIVLLIVFFTIGDILRNRAEDLAFSIARVLVFVEMVLVFREKAPRFCWQILLISLLQVVVATVFQQSMLFGLLLLLYVFAGMTVFLLIFLDKENTYFRKHSFVETFWEAIRSEIAERQDSWKLVRIALITLLTGPLSLVLSFEKTKEDKEEVLEGGKTFSEHLRALFAVFPPESNQDTGHWETVSVSATVSENDKTESDDSPPTEKTMVPVPVRQRAFRRRNQEIDVPKTRFPMLRERPGFAAGTMHANGLEGGVGELCALLIRGMAFAMVFAMILFFLIPRIGKISFYQFDFVFRNEQWKTNFIMPVNTVGFSEEVRLGSLGTVIPYYREVMSIRPTKNRDNYSNETPATVNADAPYQEIDGHFLYLRGVALDHYEAGIWTPLSGNAQNSLRFSPFSGTVTLPTEDSKEEDVYSRISWNLFPGVPVMGERFNAMFFEEDTDLVNFHLIIQPLNSKVFFAPWPFFRQERRERDRGSIVVRFLNGRMEEVGLRGGEGSLTIFSTAFRNGEQLDLAPCVEPMRRENLLQIPEKGLESLIALAKQWDDESGIAKTNIVDRARNMERRFFSDERFRYQLGGTTRSYGLDPLEDFIRDNPVGHCEYFSGALALMLRSVGIGSRVIVGFKTLAKAPGKNGYSVRQSDAHTWVEVYLPREAVADRLRGAYTSWWVRGAWLRLDPTPDPAEPTFLENVSFSLADLSQWIQSLWGEYVLNMDTEKQTTNIYRPIRETGWFVLERICNIGFWLEAIENIPSFYGRLFADRRADRWSVSDWAVLLTPIAVLGAFAYLVRHYVKRLLAWFQRISEHERRRRITIDFYVRMERILAKHGIERRYGETPKEYVLRSDLPNGTLPVVDAFYQVRYGAAELDDDELQTIRSCLDELEKHYESRLNEP